VKKMAKKSSAASKFLSSSGRAGDPVQYIATEPGARQKARDFARQHGGGVYRAVAVGRALSSSSAIDLGRGYIVSNQPPLEFVYWRQYYAKVMEIRDMSISDRIRYVNAFGEHVFEDRRVYRSWLRDSNHTLGGKKPADLIKTAEGAQQVHDVLMQIEYGLPA
jgi:hypothetical protein